MKRFLLMAAALVSAVMMSPAVPANAETHVGVSIQVGDPYRGGSIYFESRPRVVLVPTTRVYYVEDYDADIYRYGSYWYFIEEGRWYRARSYNGPFYHVRRASVPRYVLNVPPRYRRNWTGPPRHAKAHGYYKKNKRRNYDYDWRYDRDRDRDDRDYDRRDRDYDRRDRDYDRGR